MTNKKYIGSNFDDFLEDEGILEEVEAIAIKKVIAFEVEQEMKKLNLNKSELAEKMQTSRAAVHRLLDPHNTSINLRTIEKVARILGKKLRVSFA
jgi:antitoxin HicB